MAQFNRSYNRRIYRGEKIIMTKEDLYFVSVRNFPDIDGYGNGQKKNPFHIPNSAIFFIRFDIMQLAKILLDNKETIISPTWRLVKNE